MIVNSKKRRAGGAARLERSLVLGLVFAIAASGAGCSYNLPFIGRPDAASGSGTASAPAKPPKKSKPEKTATANPPRQPQPEKAAPTAKATRAKKEKPKKDESQGAEAKREKSSRKPKPSTVRERIDDAREHAAAAPAEAYWPFRLGELYASVDSIASAEVALQQSLGRDAGYAPALALMSKLYYDAHRHEEAVRLLEAARAESKRRSGDLAPELLAGLALHYDALDKGGSAREVLAAVPRSAHKATDPAAASVALRGGSPDSAAELAQAAVHENPNNAACQNNYGIARLRAGDPDAARKAFLKAVELDPKRAGPYYNLAILEKYYALDDAAAARWFAHYRTLATEDPDGLAEALGNPPAKDMAEGRAAP
jgi:tetratricopeptide (TPR) repeat protein